jgi:hypothetical protein
MHVKSDVNTLIAALKSFSKKELLAISHFLKYKKLTHRARENTNLDGAIKLYEFLHENLDKPNLMELIEGAFKIRTFQNYKSVLKELLADSLVYKEYFTDRGTWLRDVLTADGFNVLGMPEEAHNKLAELDAKVGCNFQPERYLFKALAFATPTPQFWDFHPNLSLFDAHQLAASLSSTLLEAYQVAQLKEQYISLQLLVSKIPFLRTEREILSLQSLGGFLVLKDNSESLEEISVERALFYYQGKELAFRTLGLYDIAYKYSKKLVELYIGNRSGESFDFLMPKILDQMASNGLSCTTPDAIRNALKSIVFGGEAPIYSGLEIELLKLRLHLSEGNMEALEAGGLVLEKALKNPSQFESAQLQFQTQYLFFKIRYAQGKLGEAKKILNPICTKKNVKAANHPLFEIGHYILGFLDLEIGLGKGISPSSQDRKQWQQRRRQLLDNTESKNPQLEYVLDLMLCEFLAADHSTPSCHEAALTELRQKINRGLKAKVPQICVGLHWFDFALTRN